MKKLIVLTIISTAFSIRSHGQGILNHQLIQTLDSMVSLDQKIQQAIFFNKNDNKSDSLLKKETEILKGDILIARKVFNKYGFPGFSIVGEKGAYNFWLIVQHCDKDTVLQKKVLQSMKKQVDIKNANAFNYAHLYDRVQINTGHKQLYGTQIIMDKNGNAIPENFDNWAKVDQQRKELGIESLKEYLDRATKFNKQREKEKEKN